MAKAQAECRKCTDLIGLSLENKFLKDEVNKKNLWKTSRRSKHISDIMIKKYNKSSFSERLRL
jgi:hypothetical protein